jgi:rhomboid protease GluP
MCPNCRAFITTDDKVCPYCDVPLGARVVDKRSPADALGGLIPHANFTTVVILLINTGLFIAMLLRSSKVTGGMGMDLDGQTLYEFGAKERSAIAGGQWWRLITAGFLHGGLLHILMNSWVLFDLGAQVEEAYGTSRYLVFYVVATVTGFLASYYWSASLSIGASAGIFGLIGAMIAMGLRDRSAYGAAVRGLYIRWAVYGLLMGLLPFFAIDNAAHIGGLAGGFAVAFVAGTPGFSQAQERVWQVLAGFAVAITAYSFIEMVQFLTAVSERWPNGFNGRRPWPIPRCPPYRTPGSPPDVRPPEARSAE